MAYASSITCECCLICGYKIKAGLVHDYDQTEWLRSFRAVYFDGSDVALSGILCSFRDDRPSYSANVQHNSESTQGYTIHATCWKLLEQAFNPRPVPLHRLYRIAHSSPILFEGGFAGNALRIGLPHLYGGLLYYEASFRLHQYPYCEDRMESPWNNDSDVWDESPIWKDSANDPSDQKELKAILYDAMKASPLPTCPARQLRGNDGFFRLPWELREQIAILLDTADVLHLRQASLSFSSLFRSQTFWISRFRRPGERAFVFDSIAQILDLHFQSHNLAQLYWLSNPRQIGPTLRNRRRIQNLIEVLRPLLLSDAQLHEDSLPGLEDVSWLRVSWTEEVPDHLGSISGDTSPEIALIRLPEYIVAIHVSCIDFGPMTYVTGIRFTGASGDDDRKIGYALDSRHETTVNTDGRFYGFCIALSKWGIRALQVVGTEGRSKWIGQPEAAPISERLDHESPVSAVCSEFDGFKLLSLGIQAHGAALEQNNLPLRQTRLWWPCVPPKHLDLQEHSFTGRNTLHHSYRHFTWMYFREHLARVTQVIVNDSLSIDVTCTGPDGENRTIELVKGMNEDSEESHEFQIDGPGGERITGLQVFLVQGGQRPCWLTILTNSGRRLNDPPDEKEFDWSDTEVRTIEAAPGTVVCGIYAEVSYDYSEAELLGFGIITGLDPPLEMDRS